MPFGLYRVNGSSMLPTYKPGDVLVGWRCAKPKPGDVIVARFGKMLIKRLERIEPDGRLWLIGDNTEHSTDSRELGAIPKAAFEARIIAKLASAS